MNTMSEQQGVLFSDKDLGLEKQAAVVTDIKHCDTYGLSWVYLDYQNEQTFVVLYTEDLDIKQADKVCAAVPEWWSPSVNRLYIYDALQD